MLNKVKIAALFVAVALIAAACGQASEVHHVNYSLKSALQDGKMVFVGIGGAIDGQVDPTLKADVGDHVTISLTDGDGADHNVSLPDFDAESPRASGVGNTATVTFVVDKAGSFTYFCNVPGNEEAGMKGAFVVGGTNAYAAPTAQPAQSDMAMSMGDVQPVASVATQAPTTGADIVRDPTDLPGPIGNRGPTTVRIDLEVKEVIGQLADGTTYPYWTFGGKVPGPFFRVRVGDTVEVHLKNDASNMMPHSVDFHAVTGPGGGAVMTTTQPGGETSFTFKALKPGLFVYHCATPMVAMHIANGMYGMILVEPEGGLPPVDHEFYVMQGEIYTMGKFGDKGQQAPSMDKLLNEQPEYYVLNGAVGGLSTQKPMKANVGETIRIFFGDGGPNKEASPHMIGEIFDRVYNLGSVTTPPMTDVQTAIVPPGGAAIFEVQFQVPGKYIFLDHAIVRMERGLAAWVIVQGPNAPDIYNGTPVPGSGH